ncbi:hypothetical protein CY34DRAFT_399749 [Suillus luteus UH-Slu-Lm8-n1]|uniref:Secreted protein n=1 Tax=Suillus luteus UH-Slu-Lm8-n1 TaxID=930992 RepID=A0A0D0B9U3_9AGAM|nr:hypothetical protein CY34DRAFT_399749 [Suillus luteus UH-Slu-Lm8-n1]
MAIVIIVATTAVPAHCLGYAVYSRSCAFWEVRSLAKNSTCLNFEAISSLVYYVTTHSKRLSLGRKLNEQSTYLLELVDLIPRIR